MSGVGAVVQEMRWGCNGVCTEWPWIALCQWQMECGETQSNAVSSGLLWWWISGRRDEETRIKWGLLNVTLERERKRIRVYNPGGKGERQMILDMKNGNCRRVVHLSWDCTIREAWLVVRVISVREEMFFASANNIQSERFGWWREKWMERCHELDRWGHLLTLVHPLSFCWLNSRALLLPALLSAK